MPGTVPDLAIPTKALEASTAKRDAEIHDATYLFYSSDGRRAVRVSLAIM